MQKREENWKFDQLILVNMIDMVDMYIFVCFKYIYLHTSAGDGIYV